MLGAISAQIFRDFAQIFNKSKLLGVRLHTLQPLLLLRWVQSFEQNPMKPNSQKNIVGVLKILTSCSLFSVKSKQWRIQGGGDLGQRPPQNVFE